VSSGNETRRESKRTPDNGTAPPHLLDALERRHGPAFQHRQPVDRDPVRAHDLDLDISQRDGFDRRRTGEMKIIIDPVSRKFPEQNTQKPMLPNVVLDRLLTGLRSRGIVREPGS